MQPHTAAVVIGIDVGTSGVRTLVATAGGNVLAEAQAALADGCAEGSVHEQDPHDWWRAVCHTIKRALHKLSAEEPGALAGGIAVTSTSGSLVLADSQGRPVRPAILYDDPRGGSIAEDLNRRFPQVDARLDSSYSLIKAAWVRQQEPAIWGRACCLLHPADWLTGKLTGQFETTDYSSALKLGYDVEAGGWSRAVSWLEFSPQLLPRVVRPGTRVGGVSNQASEETGLSPGTPVLAGATDGIASLLASGASEAGHANTTLGTTIVWKVLSRSKPRLAPGMYCHRHPGDLWAPGAASNTGPGSLRCDQAGMKAREMHQHAAGHFPSSRLCYLLRSRGERFPFLNPAAETFVEGNPSSPGDWYAAQLQSLAFVERWGFERLEECGVPLGEIVFSTGSAAASPVLAQLRANVLKRVVLRCRYPTSAFGAAILAAAEPLYGGNLMAALRGMTCVCERYQPDRTAAEQFEPIYRAFRAACASRGYS
jgi:sugar (pentulose or hexulose) kinase